ncbi:hypothetical protein F7D13_00100 [Methylocystis rosea]|uniref:HIRAN domain-containing protein n=1 Tax=Methylocystis rosea TaxID=173366 RepID=A0ABX6ECX0_9HYPH|nr:hypothetical protein [Methylocystis rosea]QGM92554.1 hypothetical protein F7D13_00100 [Methylocystis rosea]
MATNLYLGEAIKFGDGGNARKFMGRGWDSSSAPNGTYTVEHQAHLAFQLARSKQEMTLEIEALPFVHPPELKKQSLMVLLNGNMIGYLKAPALVKETIEFNSDVLRDGGDNLLSFIMPDAVSARELGIGDGIRPFGFCFHSVKFISSSPAAKSNYISSPVAESNDISSPAAKSSFTHFMGKTRR